MLIEDNLQGMQHWGMPVTNLERLGVFHLNVGFTEVTKVEIPAEDGPTKGIMLEKDGLTIELYQYHYDNGF